MESILRCLKALGDENRIRILMLLRQRELCVCQLMGVLGISQPLVSRHLSVLKAAGLVRARREGKLMYYSFTETARTGGKAGLLQLVADAVRDDARLARDLKRLRECTELEKSTGKCTMEMHRKFAAGAGRA